MCYRNSPKGSCKIQHGNYNWAINYLQYIVTKLTEVILYPLNFQLPSLLVAENRPATPMPIAHIGSKQQQQQKYTACPSVPLQSGDFPFNTWRFHLNVMTMGKMFTFMCLCLQTVYNWVSTDRWWCSTAGKVTIILMEYNGSLLCRLWVSHLEMTAMIL